MALGFLYGAGGGNQPEPESKALIPTMTSDTTPSGVCSASSVYASSREAWRAFDNNSSTLWISNASESNSYLRYSFNMPVVVKSIVYEKIGTAGTFQQMSFKFQASNDLQTWTDLCTPITISATTSGTLSIPNNHTPYSSYRLLLTSGSVGMAATGIQLYGYDPSWTPAKFPVIYDRGSWSVGYDNPGGYTWSGSTPANFTLNSDRISKSAATLNAMIGTTNKIDVSNFTTLHVLAKAITLASGLNFAGALGYDTDKELSGRTYVGFTTLGEVVEYTLDVTSATSIYIFLFCNSDRACDVYKIWLT